MGLAKVSLHPKARFAFNAAMNDKTILCAIDFSDSSLQALKWTVDIAQLTSWPITVLFCYRLIATEGNKETLDLKKDIESDAIKRFGEIERKLINGHAISYQFVAEVGFYSSRIETFIRKGSVGLLVMGNSIIKNFDEYKNLSFEQFLKNTKVPVVIVPEGAKGFVPV